VNRFAERLLAGGMTAAEAESKGRLLDRALRSLPRGAQGAETLRCYFVPGRIEVLGKHTDYAGGRSLLCTVEKGFCLVVRPRRDVQVRVINARSRAHCRLALNPELPPARPQWANYPGTVVRRLARNFPAARRGADIAFICDLPAAAGMSSSSAFIVAVFLALADINALAETAAYRREIRGLEDLAGYLGTVENGESFGTLTGDRGVGTFGGSEDHTAILCSRPGELRQYSFCPIRHERTVALPDGWVFVVGVSGVIAMKTGAARAKYNRASLLARKALELWQAASGRDDPTLAAAASHAPDAPDRIRAVLLASTDPLFPAGLLFDRFQQFLDESTTIVPGATKALADGDLARFGSLVDRSQRGAETRLGNQVPETMALAASARKLGAAAASAFGAGFGGSVWALVRAEEAADFKIRWAAAYQTQFPARRRCRFLITRPSPAALRF
jgi:galactokinase